MIQTTNKKEKLVEILSGGEGSSIIYTSTRKLTEEAADYLRIHGIDAIYYHAGLTTEMRRMIQDDFLSGRINTIVSTNAFGMGIDKSNIRVIVHFNMPGTLENYYQEIGRAGRDGREASIFLLYEERDELIQHYFIENAYPSRDQIEIVYNAVCNRGKIALGKVSENPVIIDKELTQLTDANKISSGILESSIKVLIESGYLKKRSETGNLHTGRFLLDPQKVKSYATEIVSNELGGLIIILAREYGSKIFNSRIQLNLSKLGESLDLTYEQVIARLEELSRLGIMEYSRPTLAPSIWLARGRVRQEELVLDSTKLKLIYNHSKTKLERMSGYVFTDDCRFKYILGYFGQSEKGYRCGKCDNCTGLKQINNSTLAYLEEIIVQTVSASEVPLPESAVMRAQQDSRNEPDRWISARPAAW